jgi:hypothetical protein
VGVVTRFERTVWATGLILRETEFGDILRGARRGPNALQELKGWGIPDQLHGWELSYDPALQRTLAAMVAMGMLNRPIPPEAGPWVQWVSGALAAMQRIAAKCWGPIPADVRRVFLDVDDLLPPATKAYIAKLRLDQPDRRSLRLGGLDSGPVRTALGSLFSGVQDGTTAAQARRAATTLRGRAGLMNAATEVRERLQNDIATAFAGEQGSQAFERAQRTVASAYDVKPDLMGVVSALRAHNRHVTRIMWCLLGVAEQFQPAVVRETVGTITEHVVDGERRLDLTVRDQNFAMIRLTHPVWLELGTPLDGLYNVERYTLAVGGTEEVDLALVSLES